MLKSKAKYQNALLILNMIITYGRLRVPLTILQRHIQYQREVKASPVFNIFQKDMCLLCFQMNSQQPQSNFGGWQWQTMYNGTGKNVVTIHAKTLIFYVYRKGLQLCIAD